MKVSHCLLLMALVCCLAGCGEDDPVASVESLDGLSLLGLVNNRALTYLQTDTVVTIDSTYDVRVTTSSEVVRLSTSAGNWTVADGSLPVLSLKVSGDKVILNGYWRKVDGMDSLFHFPTPPILMSRSVETMVPWEGFTPFFDSDSTSIARFFYYAYFGFYFTKEYRGAEELVLPAGSFTAHRFDVDLFVNQSDTIPAVRVSEYYATSVGLVKLHLQGGPLTRILSLVDFN
ncbi:MAG: hypothetical protein AB1744_12860 [Candidatus Zixiibacteriota bacterium]